MSHHNSEVFISVDRSGNVFVVFAEFVEGDDTVGDLSVPHAHELTVSFLRCLLALYNIWVLTDIVDAGDIVESDLSISVDVKFVVGLSDVANAAFAELTAEGPQKFIEIDGARVVAIEEFDQYGDLLIREVDLIIDETILKLISIQLSISIIVEDAEDSSNASNGHSTTALERVFDVLDHLLAIVSWWGLDRRGCSGITGQFNGPEVLVTDSFRIVLTDSVSIVLVGEHLGLVLSGGGHAGDFHLVAEVVPVGDAVVGQELRCRAMLEHDLVCGDHGLAGLDISQALCRPNLPARAVSHLVQEANLLVAREAGEG